MRLMNVFIGLIVYVSLLATNKKTIYRRLIFSDDFSKENLLDNWIIESNGKEKNVCLAHNGVMELNSDGGVTIWYKQKLSGNILIEYDRKVIMQHGSNDRLSDLNQFWMASDPNNLMFIRKGNFREYDSLQMYYVGMGGNYNTTTRMRRYDGKGEQVIVGELTDSAHLLQPNKKYRIEIICENGQISFRANGETYFSFKDHNPIVSGWFAFRSTRSHQLVDNVKIWQLE